MDVYLIRHTRPAVAEGVCYGRLDVPLPAECEREFDDVLARLPGDIDAVWSSPLTRCRRLAERIAAPDRELRIDPNWAELGFGRWEGRTWSEIDRTESDAWANDYWNVAPPGGETCRELHARVEAALGGLTTRAARSVAVVAHAGSIRAALAQAMGWGGEYRRLAADYGGISLLGWNGRQWRVKYVNR